MRALLFFCLCLHAIAGWAGHAYSQWGDLKYPQGFEHFELLRPIEGTDDYLVYTRWASHAHFEAWTTSQAFDRGHAQASARPEGELPAASGSTIWSFEVVQSADPA